MALLLETWNFWLFQHVTGLVFSSKLGPQKHVDDTEHCRQSDHLSGKPGMSGNCHGKSGKNYCQGKLSQNCSLLVEYLRSIWYLVNKKTAGLHVKYTLAFPSKTVHSNICR